ncbi:MAG: sodium:proton antiporter [Acidobacteria bacterium]|nr:MAG: sodium:proton antiporter [Acidobacteriota bacterium]
MAPSDHGHDGPGGPAATPFDKAPSPLMEPEGETRILAISSGKGGVGKSSLTVNLACAIAERANSVAVIDADVYGFSVPRMIGLDEDPDVENDKIVPPEVSGVKVVSMGFFLEEEQAVVWRGPMLHKALEQFITDVAWGDLDYLLIDMPPGTGDIALSISQFLPRAEVVVVTTPQPAAQRVAQRAAAMAGKVGMGVLGVIENMSWFTGDDGKRYELFGSGGGQTLAEQLGVELLGQVPVLPEVRIGSDEGRPVVISEPESEGATAIFGIADRIIAAERALAAPGAPPHQPHNQHHGQGLGASPSGSGSVPGGGLSVTPKSRG